MSITVRGATVESLGEVVEAVALWQHTGGPVQLHPGDLGWAWRDGAEQLAAVLRVWTRDGQILAVGMGDDEVVRLAVAPSVGDDAEFAARMVADLSNPAGAARADVVEARFGTALRDLLHRNGWVADDPWTPLSRDLAEPVEDCGLRVEIGDAHNAEDRVAVQRAAFDNSTFSLERWHALAAAPPYRRARCLVGYDRDDVAVAAATVWSAGEGRPGLIEPLGAHRNHRGRGHGRAITVAAASALQQMGSSSATVCTPSSNARGVAAYVSAGFRQHPEVTDFRRLTSSAL